MLTFHVSIELNVGEIGLELWHDKVHTRGCNHWHTRLTPPRVLLLTMLYCVACVCVCVLWL